MDSRMRVLWLAVALAACSADRDDDAKGTVDTDDSGAGDDTETDSPVDTDVPIDTDRPVGVKSFGVAAPFVAGGIVSSPNYRAVYRIVPPVSVAEGGEGAVRSLPPIVVPPPAEAP
ncbi:MAG: hypothetical protein H6732_20045 [Alphaproteobacteria bacterium]|nr:hypothetical protein [Alphaproteobacteria bacterium]